MDTIVLISRAHSETAFMLAREIHMDGSNIHMVFMGRGTHYLNKGDTLKELEFAKLYTFETEFDSPREEVTAIGYEDFIRLLEKCQRTFTWI